MANTPQERLALINQILTEGFDDYVSQGIIDGLVSYLNFLQTQIDEGQAGEDVNAVHVNAAAEIDGITEKATPIAADLLIIEDSADANNKKKTQIGNLPIVVNPEAVMINIANQIMSITEKLTPVAADVLIIEDTQDSGRKKRIEIGNLPNTTTVLSLHSFNINIPNRVDIGTALGTRNITYSVTNYTLATSLQLQINSVNFSAVTLPTSDGTHTVSVDLSTVDTSVATSLIFRLQANNSVNSNTQTVNVANPTPQESLYWDTETDNVASTFDYANAESQDNLSGNITVATFTGNEYLKIGYPASAAPITQLLIGGVNQLGAFTLSSNALVINTVNYDVLVSNNALDGSIVSGNVITIIR